MAGVDRRVTRNEASSFFKKRDECEVIFVCDFQRYLVSRVMDIYRFFRKPPRITLITRKRLSETDFMIPLAVRTIPIPVGGWEDAGLTGKIAALASAVPYLGYSFILCSSILRSRDRIRLVHAHFMIPQGLFGLLVARFLRIPLVITATGMDANIFAQNPFLGAVCRLIGKRAYAVIAVSRPIQSRLVKLGLRNVVYLPNSVDTAPIFPQKKLERGLVISVASLTTRKRPMMLLEAFERVAEVVPAARLVMCGEGPLKEQLRQYIENKGLAGRVRLAGRVTAEGLQELLSRAEIFVLPSASEGLSIALLEAMSAGKTVVLSRNESHAAVIRDGENGLLFEPDKPQELATQILRAINDDELRSKLSRSARRLCEEQFSNSVVASHLENLYIKAIG